MKNLSILVVLTLTALTGGLSQVHPVISYQGILTTGGGPVADGGYTLTFRIWDEYTRTYSDMIVEMTRRSMDQTLAVSEQIAGIWMDAARKTQTLLVKESEAALKLAEQTREQVKATSDKVAKMMGDFSAN